mmetsp:Transcript_36082/g.113289  ORF Transcript_36082/g.113289 Transcript_36082/m.113289 type:complete len:294 (+) Transcript_36082:2223-3104(+)
MPKLGNVRREPLVGVIHLALRLDARSAGAGALPGPRARRALYARRDLCTVLARTRAVRTTSAIFSSALLLLIGDGLEIHALSEEIKHRQQIRQGAEAVAEGPEMVDEEVVALNVLEVPGLAAQAHVPHRRGAVRVQRHGRAGAASTEPAEALADFRSALHDAPAELIHFDVPQDADRREVRERIGHVRAAGHALPVLPWRRLVFGVLRHEAQDVDVLHLALAKEVRALGLSLEEQPRLLGADGADEALPGAVRPKPARRCAHHGNVVVVPQVDVLARLAQVGRATVFVLGLAA